MCFFFQHWCQSFDNQDRKQHHVYKQQTAQHPVKWFLIYFCFCTLPLHWDDWFRNGITLSSLLLSCVWADMSLCRHLLASMEGQDAQYKLCNGSPTLLIWLPSKIHLCSRMSEIQTCTKPQTYKDTKPVLTELVQSGRLKFSAFITWVPPSCLLSLSNTREDSAFSSSAWWHIYQEVNSKNNSYSITSWSCSNVPYQIVSLLYLIPRRITQRCHGKCCAFIRYSPRFDCFECFTVLQ